MTSSMRPKRATSERRVRFGRIALMDRIHFIDSLERGEFMEHDRNIANLMLQFEREEQEAEEDTELPAEMLTKIRKKKIGKSKQACPVCIEPFQKSTSI